MHLIQKQAKSSERISRSLRCGHFKTLICETSGAI